MIDISELGLPEVIGTNETKLGVVRHLGDTGMVLLDNPGTSVHPGVILHYGPPTFSAQEFARQDGSLSGDQEPDDGKNH